MKKIICEIRCDEGIRFFKGGVCGTLRTIDACGNKHVIIYDDYNNNNKYWEFCTTKRNKNN